MRHCFIINPVAGNGKAQKALEKNIRDISAQLGEDFSVYYTKGVGDAEKYVRRLCSQGGEYRFYACGGDGTMCEVVNGVVGFSGAAVGIMPVGTGNDFVRNFTAKEKFLDIASQINGSIRRLDLIRYNDRCFVNMFNTGFDCEVVRQVAKFKTNPFIPGKIAYVAGVVKTLFRKPGVEIIASIDGAPAVRKKLLLTCIGNGSYCGGGFFSLPYASVENGKIDICFINDMTRRKFVSLVGSYKNGTYLGRGDAAEVAEYVRCSKIDVEFPCEQPISFDGEIENHKKLSLSVEPGALKFCLPEGCDVYKPQPLPSEKD